MTQEHPITPPPELVQEWLGEHFGATVTGEVSAVELHIVTQAARWGADMELEACCEWLAQETPETYINALRAARRPKPPSLKEQALDALENLNGECLLEGFECPEKVATIRRALESLPE